MTIFCPTMRLSPNLEFIAFRLSKEIENLLEIDDQDSPFLTIYVLAGVTSRVFWFLDLRSFEAITGSLSLPSLLPTIIFWPGRIVPFLSRLFHSFKSATVTLYCVDNLPSDSPPLTL